MVWQFLVGYWMGYEAGRDEDRRPRRAHTEEKGDLYVSLLLIVCPILLMLYITNSNSGTGFTRDHPMREGACYHQGGCTVCPRLWCQDASASGYVDPTFVVDAPCERDFNVTSYRLEEESDADFASCEDTLL